MTAPERSSLLSDIRVIDLANNRAEMAGRVLADLGAEVLKIEPPGGAAARRMPPFDRGETSDLDSSLYWASVAAGKESVVIDFTTEDGKRALWELIETADVLIESYDPGVLAGMGFGYEAVSARNPGLVYASVTPYGQDGPDAHSPSSELTLEAAGGLLGLQGDGDRPPVPVGHPQAAFHAGAQAAADALFALRERERSGRGQYLDVSMQACVVWTLMNATGYPANHGGNPIGTSETRALPPPELVPGVPTPALWECKDGFVTCTFSLGVLGGRTFTRMLRWAEEDGLLPEALAGITWDEWTLDTMEGRISVENANLGVETVRKFLLTKTKRELMDRAVPENLLLAPIYTTADLTVDPHLEARDYWVELAGRKHPGVFGKFSRTPLKLNPAPALGSGKPAARGKLETRASNEPRRRAFEGLKIADFAWVGVGPIISKSFADHGATVVHIESSLRPDVLRTVPPFKDATPGLDRSQFFANFNSSKLGITLNLATEAGRELAHKVVDWADVLVESFTPGTLERLGFGYKALSEKKPELVMLSTCLRGQTGPEQTYAGFGGQGAALAGLMSTTGWPDRAPRGPWGAYTDFITPRFGIAALAAALHERNTSGKGQHIDVSQIEASIHFIEPFVLDYTVNGVVCPPMGHQSLTMSPYGVYRTEGTERYIALSVDTLDQWNALRSLAPLDTFAGPQFDTFEGRQAADEAIDEALSGWLVDKDPFEIVATLKQAGVPAAVVQRPTDLFEDAQLTHREFFKICDHAVMGPTPYDGPATIFSETPPTLTAAPIMGQHTNEVLCEILGLTEEQIIEYAAADALT